MHCTTAPLWRLFVEQTKLRRLRNWNGHKMCKTEAFGWIKMCYLLEKCSMEGLLHDSRTRNDIYFILQSVKIRLIYMFNVITATSTSTSTSQQMRTIWFGFKFVLSLFFFDVLNTFTWSESNYGSAKYLVVLSTHCNRINCQYVQTSTNGIRVCCVFC